MTLFQRVAATVNKAVIPLFGAPVVGGALGRSMTVLRYTGRRSGKSVQVPVAFTVAGDTVSIGVAFPDKKSWWRNFTGDGAPVHLTIAGVERSGHATARRNDAGEVGVRVVLNPPST